MNPSGPLGEFLSAYLAEADEHLAAASARLLAVEAAARKNEAEPRAVRDLFRGLHTIKGLSAMVGVEPIVDIAHAMESTLRAGDERGGRLSPETTEVLFQGLRAIEARVRALSESRPVEPAPASLLEAFDTLSHASVATVTRPTATLDLEPALAAKLAPFERAQILDAVAAGRSAMRVDFVPSPQRAEAGITINRVREDLARLGEVVKVLPISLPSGNDRPTIAFAILLLTDATTAALAAVRGLEDAPVRIIAARAVPDPISATLPSIENDDVLTVTDTVRAGSVRVDVGRLDAALEALSTVLVDRARFTRAAATLAASGADVRELNILLQENARHVRELRGAILQLRMIPVSEILDRMPLIVRSIRRSSGKPVRLETRSGRAEFDKGVAERLFPALMHLVRNAVDHGIETPAERRAANKSEEGTVRVISHDARANRIEIEVEDDGRGIDREAVARLAGKPTPRDDHELIELLCTPGLSTRASADAVSGRGMGMDIVRRVIVDELGGEIAVRSTQGQGTTFTIRVPLTVSIIDALIVEAAAQRFAVPLSSVLEIIEIDPATVVRTPTQNARGAAGMVVRRGLAVPFVSLTALLQISSDRESTRALVVQCANGLFAVGVDRLVGQQEAVIRPMSDQLVRAPGVLGATELGDGRPTLLLDVVALSSRQSGTVQREEYS